jgi:23S rRNA (uracil1939-C5)-methyltransferase
VKVTLEKPVYGGDCLARTAVPEGKPGKAIFVPLTLPGETVSIRVTEEKRSFAKAELEEVLCGSPNRVAPLCRHYGSCGGCHYQHADYSTQLELKRQILRETLTRSGVPMPSEFGMLHGNPWGYRNRIRVARDGSGRFGYRSRRSHAIVPIEECPIAAPGLYLAVEQIAAILFKTPVAVSVTEIEVFSNREESELLVTLFCDSSHARGASGWVGELHSALREASPDRLFGIRLQCPDGSLNPRALGSSGERSLTYTAAGFAYRVDHGAFFQVNRWLIDDFTSLITSGRSGGVAWDLFAGVGLFARQLAGSFAEVLAVESAPASFPALEHNLEGTSGRAVGLTTLEFLRRNRQEREARPDLIVLDPPRAGLGEETTSLLNAIHAPEMIYVSCDPATLARDLHALTQERYRIDGITLVDMFPQSFHLETVVRLRADRR